MPRGITTPSVEIEWPRTLSDLLLHAVRQHPAASGVYLAARNSKSDAIFLPYSAILEEAQRIAGGLRACAPRAGTKVALLLESPRDFIPAFWGCVLGGYVPCPLVPLLNDEQRWSKHLAHVDSLLDRPVFLTTGRLRRELPATVASAELNELRTYQPDWHVHQAHFEDVAILVLTSGSTGNSKAVALTHANLLASMSGKNGAMTLTSEDITLNWISFDHVAALLEAHLLPLYVGATQLHVEPAAILADPLAFLRLIDSFRVSMTFTPNFLLAQINAVLMAAVDAPHKEGSIKLDLSCVRRIISGGEAIVVETGRRFLDLLVPHGLSRNALWPAFGMTETCAGSVYSREFPQPDADREFASLGQPVEGLQMRIVDEDDFLMPAGQSGELQLHGPMIFTHYHNNEEATRSAFTADGWFRSGDIGRIDDGRLSLVGRSKDSIIVNGVNYFSHELETALEQLNGIEKSFVAVFPTRPRGANTEQLVVMFGSNVPTDDEERLYQLLTAVRNTTIMLWGFRPAVILPLPKHVFPKTSLGKIQRALLRKRLDAGEFAVLQSELSAIVQRQLGLHASPESLLEKAIAEIFAAIFGVDVATLSTTVSFFDLGGTSLDILKLTQALERRFEMHAALPLVLQNPTVRMLAAHVSGGTRSGMAKYDPLVPLQVTGKKTPLFCIHPGNGEVLIMVNLAKYFVNERPFYALRPRGFNEGDEPFQSFDELVDTYLQAILKRQPTGPYAIAGYSLGAPIAFEIAKKIDARGEHVAFLGCIDGPPCEIEPPFDRITTATGLAALLELLERKQAKELEGRLRHQPSDQDPCEAVIRAASRERLAQLDLDLPKFSKWVTVAEALENILRGHVSSGRVAEMRIFLSAGFAGGTEAWHKRVHGWDALVDRPTYTHVQGEHYTLMAPKHVATFQDVLRADLNRALQGQ